jgi:inhibitor of cysteine peptidase
MPQPRVTDARVGEEFSITLPTNPTTGYSWQIDVPEELLELVARAYVRSSDLIGAGGQESVRLRPKATGEAIIVCRYRRPWEDHIAEERRFVVRIRG